MKKSKKPILIFAEWTFMEYIKKEFQLLLNQHHFLCVSETACC